MIKLLIGEVYTYGSSRSGIESSWSARVDEETINCGSDRNSLEE